MDKEAKSEIRKSDGLIPWYFVGFFLLLFALDGTFVYLAVSSHTGVVQKNSYETGLAYNDVIAEGRKNEKLGWQAKLSLSDDNRLSVSLFNKDLNPLQGAAISILAKRPTQDGYDFAINLTETDADALYSGSAEFPLPGSWELQVKIEHDNETFMFKERVLIPGKKA